MSLPEFEFEKFSGPDGTDLYAYVLKPSDFDPDKKYPLLMYTYGGPAVQNVQDRWQGFFGLWYKYLVEELDMSCCECR